MRRHLQAGGHVWMGTFTVPHHRFDKCKDLRDKLALAFRKLQGGRRWLAWRERAGVVGVVRSMEVTHGGSGWHPHLHVLFFLDCHPAVASEFGRWCFAEWSRIVERLELGVCSEGAFNWRFCNSPATAGDYVAKWGADWEVTHGHVKLARENFRNGVVSRSPWEILRDHTIDGWPGDGDLFREYAIAFKGARQLTWSRGLKEAYQIDDVDDQDVVGPLEEEDAEPVLAIEAEAVKILSDSGKTCELLEAVERGGYESGLNFMWGLNLHAFVSPPQKVLRGFFCLPRMTNDVSRSLLVSPKRAPHRGNRSEGQNDGECEDLFCLG